MTDQTITSTTPRTPLNGSEMKNKRAALSVDKMLKLRFPETNKKHKYIPWDLVVYRVYPMLPLEMATSENKSIKMTLSIVCLTSQFPL